jgi:hypothetical protein
MANRAFAKGRQRVAGAAFIRGGRMTPEAVAARMEEAAEILQRMPTDRPAGCRCSMPTPVREVRDVWTNARESGRFEDMVASPSVPSAAAIDRMDEAMGWLRLLPGEDAKLVWARACGAPWKVLVHRLGASRMTLWRRWVAAIIDISLKLNGKA